MTCPYLAYRREAADDGESDGGSESGGGFDHPRAYCSAAGRFVQAMRADICNDRYELDHATHCEIYREHSGEGRS